MIRAVIFDLDGVLVDVEDFHCRALNAGLAAYDHGCVTRARYRDQLHRYSTKTKLMMIGVPEEQRPSITAIKNAAFERIVADEFTPDPAVIDAVRSIPHPLGVVSNGSHASVATIMSKFLGSPFRGWRCGDHGDRKPAPDLYIQMCGILAVRPNECAAVEDRDDGIAAARAAGIGRVVVVASPADVTVDRMCAEGLT